MQVAGLPKEVDPLEVQHYSRVRNLAHATFTLMAVVAVLLAAAADFHR